MLLSLTACVTKEVIIHQNDFCLFYKDPEQLNEVTRNYVKIFSPVLDSKLKKGQELTGSDAILANYLDLTFYYKKVAKDKECPNLDN